MQSDEPQENPQSDSGVEINTKRRKKRDRPTSLIIKKLRFKNTKINPSASDENLHSSNANSEEATPTENLKSEDPTSPSSSSEYFESMPEFGDLHSADTALLNDSVKHDLLFKVLIIGDVGCGKTSFIKRYVHNSYTSDYKATIGVDFALKIINWNEETRIRLQLWDIAGQERYGNMTRVYYKDAVAAFILFDVTRPHTFFESSPQWKSELDNKVQLSDGSNIPCMLLGNKCDEPFADDDFKDDEKMKEHCRKHGFLAYRFISAKNNLNIEESVNVVIQKILERTTDLTNNKPTAESLKISDKDNKAKKCYKC